MFDNSVGKYRAQQLRNLAPALIGVPSHSIMCKFSQKFHRIIPATPEGSCVAVHIMAKDLELSVPIYSTFSDARESYAFKWRQTALMLTQHELLRPLLAHGQCS